MANEKTNMSRCGTRNPSNATRLPPRRQGCRLAITLMLLLGGVASANAQMGGGQMGGGQIGGGQMGGGHGDRQRNQQKAPQQTPAPPPPAVIPEPWPRLDIGAVLCKSRDDLVRYQTQAMAGSGGEAPQRPADCLIIQKRTAIKILDRDGPSRSHVISTDTLKQTGWTNAYLPSTPPPGVTTTTTAGR